MPAIYRHDFTVPESAIDIQGHVNNQAYLGWMQDVAVAHSTAQNWPMQRYLKTGRVWVVRSHFIEYLRPAYQDDPLSIYTWVADIKESSSTRKYLFANAEHHTPIARAETLWVFVKLKSGRPCPIPGELRGAFVPMSRQSEVLKQIRAGQISISANNGTIDGH